MSAPALLCFNTRAQCSPAWHQVIVLGDGSVGKTSICMRFCDDRFTAQYKQTIGVDFMSKKVSLPGM